MTTQGGIREFLEREREREPDEEGGIRTFLEQESQRTPTVATPTVERPVVEQSVVQQPTIPQTVVPQSIPNDRGPQLLQQLGQAVSTGGLINRIFNPSGLSNQEKFQQLLGGAAPPIQPDIPIDFPVNNAGQPVNPLSFEEIQARGRAGAFGTIGDIFDSLTSFGAGAITEVAGAVEPQSPMEAFIQQSILPPQLNDFLSFIREGTPESFNAALQEQREGQELLQRLPLISNASAFEQTRGEFPLAQRLALEVTGDPLNIPIARAARGVPTAIGAATGRFQGARIAADVAEDIPFTQLTRQPTRAEGDIALASIRAQTQAQSGPPGPRAFEDFLAPDITQTPPAEITIPGRNFTTQELINAGGGTRGRGFADDAIRQRNQSISIADAAEFSENELSQQLRRTRQILEEGGESAFTERAGMESLEDFIIQVINIDDPRAMPFGSLLDEITDASESASKRAVRAAQRRDELRLDAEADAIERGLAAIGRSTPELTGRPTTGAAQVRGAPPRRVPSPLTRQPTAEGGQEALTGIRRTVLPIEGTNQAVDFTAPRHFAPDAPTIDPVGAPPRTAREGAAARVDARLATQERINQSPLLKRVTQAIRDTKIVRRASSELIASQRAGRFARGMAAGEGGPVRTRARRFFAAQSGEFEKLEPENPIKNLFTEGEFDELIGMVQDPNIFPDERAFQRFTADVAFQKLFDENLLPTEGELLLLEQVFGKRFVNSVQRKRSLGRKAWSNFLAAWNFPRSMLAAGEISGSLRQAGLAAPGNPKAWLKANGAQIRAIKSERNFLIEEELIQSNPNFERFTQQTPARPGAPSRKRLQLTSTSGATPLNEREEIFLSKWADDLPVIKQSQRGFVALLNSLRMDVMDDMVGAIETGGKRATETQLDAIANYVNNLTGRGPLPVPQDVAAVLNGVFFSLRLFTSRIALPFSLITKSPGVRKKVAKDLVKGVGGILSALTIADLAGIGEVETDSRSSDWGKLKIGKQRLDPWVGYQPIARLVAQLAAGERKGVGTGSITEADRTDLILRFLRSKLHPSASAVVTGVTGEGFIGENVGLESFTEPFADEGVDEPSDLLDVRKNPIFQNISFLFVQDILDAVAEEGLFSGFKAGVAGGTGVGVTTFTSPDDVARNTFGAPFTGIYPFEQTETRAIFNAEEDEVPERLPNGDINPELPRGRQLDIQRFDQLGAIARSVDRPGLSRQQKRKAVQLYFDITSENAIRKNESRENIFGDTDFQQDSRGTDAEKAALEEYFAGQEASKSPEGIFISERWAAIRDELEQKWAREGTLLYVQANTNTKPIPPVLEAFLKDHVRSTWDRIQASKAAREQLTSTLGANAPVSQEEDGGIRAFLEAERNR